MPIINLKISLPKDDKKIQQLANEITSLTVKCLKKKPEVTAITVTTVDKAHWFINKTSLQELQQNSFYLDIKVTDGTNSKDEKKEFIAAIFNRMNETLENLHPESYVYVEEVTADAYGYAGVTQEHRYITDQKK
jgi:4-oxalocrotonate tautomerase